VSSILLVDDEPSIRFVLTELLTDEGFAVTAAADGVAALRLLDGGPKVDAFLLDLFMPSISGRELVGRIRAMKRYADVPIVLITGAVFAPEDDPPQGSYQALIAKPFDIVDVVSTVRRLTGCA
jgi:CheY-like chemotaxis protein